MKDRLKLHPSPQLNERDFSLNLQFTYVADRMFMWRHLLSTANIARFIQFQIRFDSIELNDFRYIQANSVINTGTSKQRQNIIFNIIRLHELTMVECNFDDNSNVCSYRHDCQQQYAQHLYWPDEGYRYSVICIRNDRNANLESTRTQPAKQPRTERNSIQIVGDYGFER